MQKKITLIFILFVLMINIYVGVMATENSSSGAEVNNATVDGMQGEEVSSDNSIVNGDEINNNTIPENSNPENSSDYNSEFNLIQTNTDLETVRAKVIEAGEVKKITTGSVEDTIQEVKIKILEGEFEDEEYITNYVLSYDIEGKILAYELKEGNKVSVQISKNQDGTMLVTVQEVQRDTYMYLMFIVFLLSVVLVGGKQGIKAVIGLLITIIAIYFILIKGIYAGKNAIFMSILTSAVVIVLTFFVIGGISKKIITAAIGTLGGVVMAGIMAGIFSYLTKLSGACEDAIQLSINMKNVTFNFRDLIFAGIVTSSLGACMDVGMSIASSLDELKNKTKDISWKELFKSGMNIGRDVIGTMTNTLILAYVGGALKLILLFMACDMHVVEILNKEAIVEEVISAIAGSMGVVYTVPITAFIYAFFNREKTIYRTVSKNKIEGRRSLKI